jgi:hypothetical protein
LRCFLSFAADVDIVQVTAKETEYVEADFGAGELLLQADSADNGSVAKFSVGPRALSERMR